MWGGWGDTSINIHFGINMHIDIHIIIDMNIECYIDYYTLVMLYRCPIGYISRCSSLEKLLEGFDPRKAICFNDSDTERLHEVLNITGYDRIAELVHDVSGVQGIGRKDKAIYWQCIGNGSSNSNSNRANYEKKEFTFMFYLFVHGCEVVFVDPMTCPGHGVCYEFGLFQRLLFLSCVFQYFSRPSPSFLLGLPIHVK